MRHGFFSYKLMNVAGVQLILVNLPWFFHFFFLFQMMMEGWLAAICLLACLLGWFGFFPSFRFAAINISNHLKTIASNKQISGEKLVSVKPIFVLIIFPTAPSLFFLVIIANQIPPLLFVPLFAPCLFLRFCRLYSYVK